EDIFHHQRCSRHPFRKSGTHKRRTTSDARRQICFGEAQPFEPKQVFICLTKQAQANAKRPHGKRARLEPHLSRSSLNGSIGSLPPTRCCRGVSQTMSRRLP